VADAAEQEGRRRAPPARTHDDQVEDAFVRRGDDLVRRAADACLLRDPDGVRYLRRGFVDGLLRRVPSAPPGSTTTYGLGHTVAARRR
jgi:hypothetical protein